MNEQDNSAYPRCAMCKHWRQESRAEARYRLRGGDEVYGECSAGVASCECEGYGGTLCTPPDFGCVQHEEKP